MRKYMALILIGWFFFYGTAEQVTQKLNSLNLTMYERGQVRITTNDYHGYTLFYYRVEK